MNNIKYPKLKIISEQNRGTVFDLKKKRYTCGRNNSNDIVFSDASISSNHCELLKDKDSYIVRDIESANGTSVNDVLIDEKVLKNNDIITIGGVKLLFDAEISEGVIEGKEVGRIRSGINPDLFDNETPFVNEMKNISPFAGNRKSKSKMPQIVIMTIIVLLALTVIGLLIWLFYMFYSQ